MAKTGTPDPPSIVRDAHANGFIRVNRAFHQTFGYTADELMLKPLLDWIEPADRAAFQRALREGSLLVEARHQTMQGDWVLIKWQVRSEGEGPVVFGKVYPTLQQAQYAPLQNTRLPETMSEMAHSHGPDHRG